MLIIDWEKQAWLMDLIVLSTTAVIADNLGGREGGGGDLESEMAGYAREKYWFSLNIWNNMFLSLH